MANNDESTFADMREDYLSLSLRKRDLDPDPFQQFHNWFKEACAAELPEPNAMTLSTLGIDKIPSSRTVLLKAMDQRGFSFFTNYNSQKGREIEAHPAASLLFLWKEHARQVIIRGRVEKVSIEESEKYFYVRPYESRIGAWASEQSAVIPNREWLEERDQKYRAKFPETEDEHCVPIPEFWGGYRVVPMSIEFWQGGHGRLHDRFRYIKSSSNKWEIQRLSP